MSRAFFGTNLGNDLRYAIECGPIHDERDKSV